MIKTVALGLGLEIVVIHDFVIIKKLADVDIPQAPVADHDRGDDIPEPVAAFIDFEGAGRDVRLQGQIAFPADLAGLRMDAVKLGADILPAGGHQDIPRHIDDAHADVGELIKIIHHRLQQPAD